MVLQQQIDYNKFGIFHTADFYLGRPGYSTLAEEVPASPESHSGMSKVDAQLNTIERYMRHFGRISRKQLDPIVASFDKEGTD
jgi:hypothetical protein